MGINVQGMMQGLGSSLSQVGQAGIQNAYAAEREKNMARYRSQQMEQGHQNALELQGNHLGAQTQTAEAKAYSDEQQRLYDRNADIQKRQNELTDAETAHNRKMEIEEYKALKNPSGTNVTTNTNVGAGETEYQKTLGREQAKADVTAETEVKSAIKAAMRTEDSLGVMEEIMKKMPTGKTEEALAAGGQWLGTEAGQALQEWKGVQAPMVLSAAEGLKGVLSDRDMEILYDTVPKFGNSKEANETIIRIMRKGIKRTRENYRSMQTWKGKNGSLRGWTPEYDNFAMNEQEAATITTPQLGTGTPTMEPAAPQPAGGNMLDMFNQFEQENYGGN